MAMEGQIVARSQRGQRTIPTDRFFTGYYETVLAQDEIVTEILIPKQPAGSGTAFLKFLPATQDDYATISVAARVALNGNGTVAEARIALGVYVLAFTMAFLPNSILGAVINNVSMPAFSRVKHDPALLKNSIATAVRGVSLIVIPMSAMTVALARPLVLTVYGAKWAAAVNVLVVLAFYGTVFIVCLLSQLTHWM